MIVSLFCRIVLGWAALATAALADSAAQFYVALDGSDGADGSLAHPFASLEAARAAVRKAPGGAKAGATVFLRGGAYPRTATFILGSEDSGSNSDPVIYRSYAGESARLLGGRELPASAFAAIPASDPIRRRLDATARRQVRRIFLPDQGIRDYGPAAPRDENHNGPAALELFSGGRALPAAQLPDPNLSLPGFRQLSLPGDWYLDRATGWLYLWPESPAEPVYASVLTGDLIALRGASGILLEDLTLEVARGRLLSIAGGADNLVRNCTLRAAGGDGVELDGRQNGLDHCTITELGGSAVQIGGGVRATLTPGGNFVRDCTIRQFALRSWNGATGVRISGVGQLVANNLIADSPSPAVEFAGNNHRIELNEIFHVAFIAGGSAVAGGGRWDFRGSKIRHNFLHDLASPVPGYEVGGVGLEDGQSGTEVSGNIFYRLSGAAITNDGGRDNTLTNNVMVECGAALSLTASGLKLIEGSPAGPPDRVKRLHDEGVDYQGEPWKSAYPQLAALPDDWTKLSAPGALWLAPVGNVFERNVGYLNRQFIAGGGGDAAPDRWLMARDNLEDEDPQFVDPAKLNLALKTTSPVFRLPRFQPILFDAIGPH